MERVIDYSKAVDMMLNHSKMILEDAQYSYIHQSIEKIAKWWIQCDQSVEVKEDYIETLRVVRITKGIPKYAINVVSKANADDASPYARTFLAGLYMVVPCIHFSKEYASKSLKDGKGRFAMYKIPKELKSSYEERTLRFNNDGSAICLAKSDLTDWVYSGSHYKMLEVGDI